MPLIAALYAGLVGFEPARRDTPPPLGDTLVIRLATLAPNGSAWHEILKEMSARWREASGGLVTLRIYPGGVAGEEEDILRRIGEGQLQAGSLSLAGLSRITPQVYVLAIPMAMKSWDDLARVREVMQPRLEAVFAEKGYVLLNWGDIGWVRFFLPKPDPSLDAVREYRFVAWADDSAVDLWKDSGFRSVYLELADVLPGLEESRIDAIGTTPLFMLANRWYPLIPFMVEMPWAPLVGATLIDRETWTRIPSELRPELLRIAHEAGERMQAEIQRMEVDAVAAMEARGLEVIHPDPEQLQEWRRFFEEGYPALRGPLVPEEWFDEVLRLTGNPG
ncbi:MAG: TRAP transporter substrate-binding protein DctP [Gemmatimonadota bacterium]